MLPLLWPYNFDSSAGFLNFLLLLAGLVISGFTYHRYNYRRILGDPDVTDGLTPEQRLRLELGLIDNLPGPDFEAVIDPDADTGRRAIGEIVRNAREASRRRERGDFDDLSPAELTRLRTRMDHLLRERWGRIEQAFLDLRADHSGASWGKLVNGELGLMALLTDLALELHAAKHQATYPPVVLQLEGPLGTLADVVRHAQQSVDPATPKHDAHLLRSGVLAFTGDVFPGICENIHETEVPYPLDEEFELAREVELTSQDLPSQ
jgi:hypothetical protein